MLLLVDNSKLILWTNKIDANNITIIIRGDIMLKVKNLSKIYPKNDNKALNNINMTIEKKEIVGLVGPNGAGKTTFINIISGLLTKNKGDIYINKMKLNKKNKYKIMKKIGVTFEGARNLYWALNVVNNFKYFGTIKGATKKLLKDNITFFSKKFGIESLLQSKVKTLSRGQKQRVSIVSSLLHDPQMLIYDEPTNGLDIESRTMLINYFKRIKNELEKTILITSHDTEFLRKVVDRFIILNEGKIIKKFKNKNMSNEEIEKKYHQAIS